MAKKKKVTSLRVGVIGCGNISGAYFTHKSTFAAMKIVACADLVPAAARAAAKKHEVKYMGIKTMLADSSIDAILNLTIPQAHAKVNIQALKAGKHVYCEKPFGVNREETAEVLALAKKKE